MKTSLTVAMFAFALAYGSSCQNNQQKEAQADTSSRSSEQKVATESLALPAGTEKIIGEWELLKIVADDNGDHKLDPAEDAKAITTMQDNLKLNADGTCAYTIANLEGTYKIISEDGRNKLVMYDRTGTETNRGRYILSVTDKELVINRILSGSDFEVFKRK